MPQNTDEFKDEIIEEVSLEIEQDNDTQILKQINNTTIFFECDIDYNSFIQEEFLKVLP